MKTLARCALTCVFLLALAACGGGDDDGGNDGVPSSCVGSVCSNCATDPACDVDCAPGEVNFCGHFGYFSDPDLRCSWCGPDT